LTNTALKLRSDSGASKDEFLQYYITFDFTLFSDDEAKAAFFEQAETDNMYLRFGATMNGGRGVPVNRFIEYCTSSSAPIVGITGDSCSIAT
jgi:hypothetical protein